MKNAKEYLNQDKGMTIEIPKNYHHGFILTEQDLWSIKDDIEQQMERETKEDVIIAFELTYKNGAKATKASLNDVISENNGGKWEIRGFKMEAVNRSRSLRIRIEFRVPPVPANRDNTTRPYSISYYILGNERDWVYLTSSKLDDRIARIKGLPISDYGIFPIIIGFVGAFLLVGITNGSHPTYIPIGIKISLYLAALLFIIGGITAIYYFPRYNFCWGDYLTKFSNRRAVGKYIFNTIIVALVISVLGGVFGTILFLK